MQIHGERGKRERSKILWWYDDMMIQILILNCNQRINKNNLINLLLINIFLRYIKNKI